MNILNYRQAPRKKDTMRNRYAGPCYRCGKWVKPGEGEFARILGRWPLQHASYCIEAKEEAAK